MTLTSVSNGGFVRWLRIPAGSLLIIFEISGFPILGALVVSVFGRDRWAVTSDASHTFSTIGGVLIALVAQRLSERPASAEHTFSWGRAEIIGAMFYGTCSGWAQCA